MRDDIIFHLVSSDDWKKYQNAGLYEPPSLEEEGFIHCSNGSQVQRVANQQFNGRDDVMLIVIDVASLESEVKLEQAAGTEEKFPHINGPLNIDAIIDKIKLATEEDGSFYIEFDSKE